MTIIKEFNQRMIKAFLRKDLHTLENLSQTILSLLNRPYTLKPFLTKTEQKNLNALFEKIAVYIVTLTVRSKNVPSQLHIRRKGIHHG